MSSTAASPRWARAPRGASRSRQRESSARSRRALALATEAVLGGCALALRAEVAGVSEATGGDGARLHRLRTPRGDVKARFLVNAAGLRSDEVDAMLGHGDFEVRPRRGELIVYDKLASGAAAPRAAAGADREDQGGAGLAHRLRQRAAGANGRRRAQQDRSLDHGRRPRLAAGAGRAHPPRPRRLRGDGHLRRAAGRDRGPRLPAPRPPRAALRLRGWHPLDRGHRFDGDRRARARGPGRGRAGAGRATSARSSCGCRTSASSGRAPISAAS